MTEEEVHPSVAPSVATEPPVKAQFNEALYIFVSYSHNYYHSSCMCFVCLWFIVDKSELKKSLRGNRFVSTARCGKQRNHMDLGKQQQTTLQIENLCHV